MIGSVHGKSLKCLVLSEYYLSVRYDDCYCLCKKCDLQNDLFGSIKDDWVFILFSFVVWHVLGARRCLFIGYDLGNIWKISSSNISWFIKLHGYSHCFLVCLCPAHTGVFTLPWYPWRWLESQCFLERQRPDECVLLLKVNMSWERKAEECGTEVFSLLGEGRGRQMVSEGSLRYTWLQVVPKMNQFHWEGWVQKWCGFSRIKGVCNKLECFSTINRTLDLGKIWVRSRICLMVKEKHTHKKKIIKWHPAAKACSLGSVNEQKAVASTSETAFFQF